MMKRFGLFLILLSWFFLGACKSLDNPQTPLPVPEPQTLEAEGSAGPRSIVDDIRSVTETGTPSSLSRALDMIRSLEVGNSGFGRAMNGVNGILLKTLYPAVRAEIPPLDFPQNNTYARILRDAEKGIYTPPASRDYLEQTLPFLAFYPGYAEKAASPEQMRTALPDLRRAAELNPASVLAPYFTGVVYEHSGLLDEAFEEYSRAWELSSECYPAALALARIMENRGQTGEALQLLSDLSAGFPENYQVKRALALIYYRTGDRSQAERGIDEILSMDSRDGEFILMKADLLIEARRFFEAQTLLDSAASINPGNRRYLLLKARVQYEGFRNRDAALSLLRPVLRNSGKIVNDEATVYAARLFMESSGEAEAAEGRLLLQSLLEDPAPSLGLISLALEDAIRRRDWEESRGYLERLLAERRSSEDLFNAYAAEREQGNREAALSYARELYERDPSGENGISAYTQALIDAGRRNEAAQIIDVLIQNASGGALKSRYYYLRSRTRGSEEETKGDLQSSLFEDPRNLNSLISMFEIYHRNRDGRRAVYYLKQALVLAPDNPRLKRYETEYAPLLGS